MIKMSQFILILSIISLCSCVTKRSNTIIEKKEFIEYVEDYSIPKSSLFVIDTTYIDYIKNEVDSLRFKDYLQPFQILLFENDSLIYHQANCFVKSSLGWTLGINMDWNGNNALDSYPPILDTFRILHPLSLNDYSQHLYPLFDEKSDINIQHPTYIVVFSHFLPDFFEDMNEALNTYFEKHNIKANTYYLIADRLYKYEIK